MKVAILLGDGVEGRGGTEKMTKYFMSFLAQNAADCRIEVLRTRCGAGAVAKHLTTPLVLFCLFLKFRTQNYDLAHVNVGPKGSTIRKVILGFILRATKTPYIVHLHGSGYDSYFRDVHPVIQRLVAGLFQGATKVVVLGAFWKDFVQSAIRVEESRAVIVSNGVPDIRRERAIATDPLVISSLGVVGTRKGMDVLIQSLAALPPEISWRCIIGGNGEVGKYAALAADLGIDRKIEFTGWVDEKTVAEILNNTDIFVLASRFENQPLTILEAMAAGVPVISTRIGAIPEQIEDGVSGILTEAGDVAGLTTALTILISDGALRISMSQAARASYERNFSLSAYTRRMLEVYRAAVGESQRVN
jgi:glycosyltransferase involved in cell wall biosynthesis